MQKRMLIVPSTVSKLLSELENNSGFPKAIVDVGSKEPC